MNDRPKHGGGPKTPEGKKRSSLNALKHGLNAQSDHALEEISKQHGVPYEEVLGEMLRHYAPADPVERQLVQRIARCVWRLSLSASMEERLIERRPNAPKPGTTYDRILKYERLVDIHLHRALATLQRKRESEGRSMPNKNKSHNELYPRSF
jgi:hypothetical protein